MGEKRAAQKDLYQVLFWHSGKILEKNQLPGKQGFFSVHVFSPWSLLKRENPSYLTFLFFTSAYV